MSAAYVEGITTDTEALLNAYTLGEDRALAQVVDAMDDAERVRALLFLVGYTVTLERRLREALDR